MTWKSGIDGHEDVGLKDGVSVGDAILQLAAYEDTGLSPETVSDLLDRFNYFRRTIEGLDLVDHVHFGAFVDRVKHWAQAEKDGRLVVLLECVPGDPPPKKREMRTEGAIHTAQKTAQTRIAWAVNAWRTMERSRGGAEKRRRQTMRLIDAEPIIKNLSAMKTQLGYDAIDIDGMIKALREAEEVEVTQTPNDPLTLKELREMGKEPEPIYIPGLGWRICWGIEDSSGKLALKVGVTARIYLENYGKGFVAYRCKPEEGQT